MEILVLFAGFAPLVGAVGFVAAIIYVGRELLVKSPRRRRWIADHDGHLIGSKEFFGWCEVNGVDPRYYL